MVNLKRLLEIAKQRDKKSLEKELYYNEHKEEILQKQLSLLKKIDAAKNSEKATYVKL